MTVNLTDQDKVVLDKLATVLFSEEHGKTDLFKWEDFKRLRRYLDLEEVERAVVMARQHERQKRFDWLKKWCAKHEIRRFEYDSEYVVVREDLLSAAEKNLEAGR